MEDDGALGGEFGRLGRTRPEGSLDATRARLSGQDGDVVIVLAPFSLQLAKALKLEVLARPLALCDLRGRD
jgi:hypothetical protein